VSHVILLVGQLEKFDFSVNEILASKKLRNAEEFPTTYADISLTIKNKENKDGSENVRFTITKDKALSLISGNRNS